MRIHLIQAKTVRMFAAQHPSSKSALEDWLSTVNRANWKMPGDIKKTFRSADLLGKSSSRVIFDIAGNYYRMICKYAFGETQVHLFVCWIGTHADYDKLCNDNKQYTINLY